MTTVQPAKTYLVRDYEAARTLLAELIHLKHVTQKDLAHRIGIHPQTLSFGLNRRHRMDAPNLLAAFTELGYDLLVVPRERA